MMDIEKAKEEFLGYVNSYDMNNINLSRKVAHSFRVMKECKNIANSLELSEEEIKLAEIIGLLHDIGRFEQMKVYKTFYDQKSIDHGDLGKELLEDNNLIRRFVNEDKYDFIIKSAVKNHNKLIMEEGLDDYTKTFCDIIRDADKIDILYESTNIFWSTEEAIKDIENNVISEECYYAIINNTLVNNKHLRTKVDSILGKIAHIYDMKFKYSLKKIYDEDYINITLNRFNYKNKDTISKIEKIRKISYDYLNDRIN